MILAAYYGSMIFLVYKIYMYLKIHDTNINTKVIYMPQVIRKLNGKSYKMAKHVFSNGSYYTISIFDSNIFFGAPN